MNLTPDLSNLIITTAYKYLGYPYNRKEFNCVHFVRRTYESLGIYIPSLSGSHHPPSEYHLSADEFDRMPIGHCVFFKRLQSRSERIWTHVAIVISPDELIHCSEFLGSRVVVTPVTDFLSFYELVPKV